MKLITPIILIVISALAFFFYVNPTYKDIRDVSSEIERYDDALNNARDLAGVRDALLLKYNSITSNDLDRLEKLLPDHVDNVRLILDIDSIAARYGISLQNVSVNIAEEGSDITTSAQRSDGVGEITLGFSIISSYNTFTQFLNDIEDNLRLVDVESVSFDSGDDDTTLYNFEVKTYWLQQ